jgi:hypothetical protein
VWWVTVGWTRQWWRKRTLGFGGKELRAEVAQILAIFVLARMSLGCLCGMADASGKERDGCGLITSSQGHRHTSWNP